MRTTLPQWRLGNLRRNYAWKYVCRSFDRTISRSYHQSWRTDGMLRENVSRLDWCLFRTINFWFLGTKPKRYSHYSISSRGYDFASHFLGKRKLSFAMEGRLTLKNKREAGTKVLASQLSLDCRIKTQWLSGLYYADFISFYSPTQLCGGGTTKSNSNELPISVPLSLFRSLYKVI